MSETAVRTTRPENAVAAFSAGFAAPWTGLRYMNRHKRLWRHAILPIACNIVLTTLMLAGLVFGGVELFEWLQSFFPAGIGWMALKILAGLALAVVALLLTFAAWILFQGILCGHFYSLLAREVEIQLGMKSEEMREVSLGYQVYDALRDLAALTGVAVGCLVLPFVPVVGPLAAIAIGGYFNCLVFGMDYFDYPQALRAHDRRVQRAFAQRNRAATLGLGASVTLLSLIPILSPVMLTTAATGAVLLHRRLETPGAPSN